jgi:phosphate transport system substrate-binding protein
MSPFRRLLETVRYHSHQIRSIPGESRKTCPSNRYLCVLWITLFGVFFDTAAFSGRFIDEANAPIGGVSLMLAVSGLQTTTLGDGTFSFSTGAFRRFPDPARMDKVQLSGTGLIIRVDQVSIPVRIEWYSLSGQRVATVVNRYYPAGTHRIDCLPPQRAGIFILRACVGASVFIGRMVVNQGTISGRIMATAGKMHAVETRHALSLQAGVPQSDTLIAIKPGYITKRVIVSPECSTLGDLRLYDTIFEVTPETFPKIDGSTTTIPLTRIICLTLMNKPWVWRQPAYTGSLWEIVPDDSTIYKKITAISKHSTTHNAFDSLILGTRDILLEARVPSADELDTAAAHGVKLDWQPCGLDALVMVVNKNNPVSGMTTQDIRGIYTGAITNWQALGGSDQVIRPYQREANSGSQEMMLSLIMKDTPIKSSIPILMGMMTVFEQLDYIAAGISFTPYYYKEMQVRDTLIRSLAIDSIAPTHATIESHTYPHCAEVFVVTRAGLSDTTSAAKLRDWLLSDAGQGIIEKSGYVPVRKAKKM